jgi:hypothetical protein
MEILFNDYQHHLLIVDMNPYNHIYLYLVFPFSALSLFDSLYSWFFAFVEPEGVTVKKFLQEQERKIFLSATVCRAFLSKTDRKRPYNIATIERKRNAIV